jgi:ribosomal protein L29
MRRLTKEELATLSDSELVGLWAEAKRELAWCRFELWEVLEEFARREVELLRRGVMHKIEESQK